MRSKTAPPHVQARRAQELIALEDAVLRRLANWSDSKLHDLILYGVMNRGEGIRIEDIDRLIHRELVRMFPDTWTDAPLSKT